MYVCVALARVALGFRRPLSVDVSLCVSTCMCVKVKV